MRGAILFDLDETLVVEEPAAVAAFEATANVAARRYGLDASEPDTRSSRTHVPPWPS